MSLKLLEDETGIVDAALAIAQERENTTRDLARAVLDNDLETAKKIAKELLPNEASSRARKSINRVASR